MILPRLAASMLLLVPLTASIGDTPDADSATQRWFDRVWQKARLYQDPAAAGVQSFKLIGRYHGQQWWVDADQGRASDWENRRIIFGFSSGFLHDYKLQVQMKINEDLAPVYGGLYEAYLGWQPEGRDYSIRLGRLDYVYTGLERSTSSNRIDTIERGQLVNQVMPGEVVGVLLKGTGKGFGYQAGLFSGNIEQEFSDFSAGLAAMAGVSHPLPLLFEEGHLHADYLYNDGAPENNAFKTYRHLLSFWHQGSSGRFGLGSDLTFGRGLHGTSDVVALTLIPRYRLAHDTLLGGDVLDLALRYQYSSSDQEDGLLLQKRYEQAVTTGSGDRYQALYAGLNYYPYKKLKVMLGSEYAVMQDRADNGGEYRGWTHALAIRFYFD